MFESIGRSLYDHSMLVTDMKHLFPENWSDDIPPEARRIREFLGLIVKAASATSKPSVTTGLPCRKRPGNRPCSGYIRIERRDLPTKSINWGCSKCDDGGVITNWQGTYFELLPIQEPSQPAEDNQPMTVMVSREEYAALLKVECFDIDSDHVVYSGEGTAKGVKLTALESDMENLIGFVASESNHTTNRKHQKLLDAVYGRVDDALQEIYESRDSE